MELSPDSNDTINTNITQLIFNNCKIIRPLVFAVVQRVPCYTRRRKPSLNHGAKASKELIIFQCHTINNAYNLRNRETDLAPPMPRKEFGKRCFSYNGAIHWNNLPYQAKIAESLSSFKTLLKQRMS